MKSEAQITNHERRATSNECVGSALILTVVLTSLLAIVGVLFVMISRVDKMATSSISEYKELNFAVESVVAKISEELALDVPGVSGQEYYDYPGFNDIWLASLEPELVDVNGTPDPNDDIYQWRQISDIAGYFAQRGSNQNVQIQVNINDILFNAIVEDHKPIIAPDGTLVEQLADADGDGIADSKWIELENINTIKGKQIYAAVRIIDNGGMLNVNTAYEFNPAEADPKLIDGSSQLQINLMALAGRPPLPYWPVGEPYIPAEKTLLLSKRDMYGVSADLDDYKNFVVWSYDELAQPYTPFDISDELEIRYRFMLNHPDIDTRLEPWGGEFRNNTSLQTPISPTPSDYFIPEDREKFDKESVIKWFKRAHFDPGILYMADLNDPNYYTYRHIATTYNMDRIINPAGAGFNDGKMINVNRISNHNDLAMLSEAIWRGLYDAGFDDNALAAQIAVNIKDYVDLDSDVTNYNGYFGFESPCIYISELVHNFVPSSGQGDSDHYSYAVELYRPDPDDGSATDWQLVIDGNPIPISWPDNQQFYVIRNEDPDAPLEVEPGVQILTSNILVFGDAVGIELQRDAQTGEQIIVDSKYVPNGFVSGEGIKSCQRDITRHKCIRRLWDRSGTYDTDPENLTLGSANIYVDDAKQELIQIHPANKPFTNIGEIGMIFCKPAYYGTENEDPILGKVIGYSSDVDTEDEVRVNLANPKFHQLFKYLTVFDPLNYVNDTDADETRIKGRININTAPWFVIAQLPWITNPNLPPADPNRFNLAKTIVAYRDKGRVFDSGDPNDLIIDYSELARTTLSGSQFPLREDLGFENIGELATVVLPAYRQFSMAYYIDDEDEIGFPDLTTDVDPISGVDVGDGAPDDFEERDLIFSRISNLVTVRSDVFTAYILVRIGIDGPQKRVLAILDRSDVTSTGGKVKILALHPVPDPR